MNSEHPMLQQFLITLTDARTGPRGRKGKPVVVHYAVAALSEEEALAAFRAECPAMIADGTLVTVTPLWSLVAACR